jgi:hypothetical protein
MHTECYNFIMNKLKIIIAIVLILISIIIIRFVNSANSTPTKENANSYPISYTNQNELTYSVNGIAKMTIPQNWKTVVKLPDNLYSKDFGAKDWENSKMFIGNCTGGFVQREGPGIAVIAIDIKQVGDDGAFCWSNGNFSDYTVRKIAALPGKDVTVSKWKNADYSMDKSNNIVTPKWQGDYFEGLVSFENEKYFVFVSLYVNGTDLNTAEQEFDNIISTFKFN